MTPKVDPNKDIRTPQATPPADGLITATWDGAGFPADPTPAAPPGRRLIRVNVMLTPGVMDFLDRTAARAARETGEPVVSRSGMIRALCGAFAGLNVSGFRNEAALQVALTRLLKRIASDTRGAAGPMLPSAPRHRDRIGNTFPGETVATVTGRRARSKGSCQPNHADGGQETEQGVEGA
jgi:hypothetical protein